MDDSTPKPSTQGSESLNMVFPGLVGLALAVVALTTVMLRRRAVKTGDDAWGDDAFSPLLNTEALFELEAESDVFEEHADGKQRRLEPKKRRRSNVP